MSNRKAITMLVLGILAAGLANFLLSVHGVGTVLVERTSLVDATPDGVDRIEIIREYGPATVFAKDGSWSIEKPFKADADEARILRLLDALCFSRPLESFSEQELAKFGRTRDDYGLESPFLKVKVVCGDRGHEVSFGIKTPAADGVFFCVAGDQSVFVAGTNVLSAVNIPPDAFRNRALASAMLASADSFDLKRGRGDFARFAKKDGKWLVSRNAEDPAGDASGAKIEKFLSLLGSAKAVDFKWPVGSDNESPIATSPLLAGYGLDPDNAVAVTLHAPGRPDEQIAFGRDAGGGCVYALVQNGRAVATVQRELKDAAENENFLDTRLFPVAKEKIARISVTDGETPFVMAKNDKGEWAFETPPGIPCDAANVSKMLDRLTSLVPAEPGADDADTLVVNVGNGLSSKSVSRKSLFPDFQLEDLRSTALMQIKPENVRRLTAAAYGDQRPVSVAYDPDRRQWTVESPARGMMPIQQSIEGILGALEDLKADKIVKIKVSSADLRKYGLEKPRFTVSVDTAGSMRRNILVGEKSQGGCFASLGALDSVFILPDKTVRRLAAPLATE